MKKKDEITKLSETVPFVFFKKINYFKRFAIACIYLKLAWFLKDRTPWTPDAD